MRPALRALLSAALLAVAPAGSVAADDGDLDPSFNGGAFTLGWSADHARAWVLEPIADGGLLVGGTIGGQAGGVDTWAVIQLEADGSRDQDWAFAFDLIDAGDETMATNGPLYAMRRDASQRAYLAGVAEAGIDNDVPMLARLTPEGALDTAFDGNGLKVIDDMPASWVDVDTRAAAVLPDGRSVFVGTCSLCPLAGETWMWVTRRLADGTPDTSFQGDGWHSTRFGLETESLPTSVAVDELGRIVIAGEVSFVAENDNYFARMVATGAFDGSFGEGDGIAGPLATETPRTLALDPATGRIAAGSFDAATGTPGDGHVYVYTAAGAPDTTFSGDGHVDLDREEGTSIRGLAFQSDGKLLAVGVIDANGTNQGGFFLARMTSNGELDASFDDNGFKRVEFDAAPTVRDGAYAVATMGGRLVAVGYAGAGGGQEDEMAVVRTESALIFTDGFERGTAAGWAGY